MTRPHKAATLWTVLLSVTFAVLLFPVLLDDIGREYEASDHSGT